MNVKKRFSLKNQVAVITGGAGYLGEVFAQTLAEAGAKVVIVDIHEQNGEKVAKRVAKKTKQKVTFEKVFTQKEEEVTRLFKGIYTKYKRIDILVNAAMGVGKKHWTDVEHYDYDDWNEVMGVNVGGVFLCCREAAKYMKKKKKGAIINIGSIYGVVAADQNIYGKSGINSPAVYAASKGAVIQLSKYFAAYWAPQGIRVNSISPGGVFRNQDKEFVKKYSAKTPLGRMVNKEELSGAILYLASDASSMVTGHNLLVDGGWTAW